MRKTESEQDTATIVAREIQNKLDTYATTPGMSPTEATWGCAWALQSLTSCSRAARKVGAALASLRKQRPASCEMNAR